jgi:hypothetical protein
MVSGHGVREQRLWCYKGTVEMLESNDYCVGDREVQTATTDTVPALPTHGVWVCLDVCVSHVYVCEYFDVCVCVCLVCVTSFFMCGFSCLSLFLCVLMF